MDFEVHVQLQKKPGSPFPDISAYTFLKRRSEDVANEIRLSLRYASVNNDWTPFTVAFICPKLLDSKLQVVSNFVMWAWNIPKEVPDWVAGGGSIHIASVDERYANDAYNRLLGVGAFSPLTTRSADSRMMITPVIFMTYRHVGLEELVLPP